MPATVSTRGVLKASTNRVRTSTALQGSAMWENVIGIVNEERGTNAGVEALINAPQRGGGNHNAKKEARRAAAAEAVLATGGFDTAITSYNELLSLAKSQGAMGEGATRGACKVCGQLGHLTKQCRNQFSKFYQNDDGPSTAAGAAANAAIPSADGGRPALSGDSLESLGRDSDKLSSDSSSGSSSSDSDSEEERRRRKKKKEKKRKRERERKEKKRRHKERDHGGRSSSGKDKKHKKSKRHRSRSRSPKRERRD
ncbi:hypothetical protein NADE_003589 [Nannochloris sp. 'desiccata']|nr:hypothetical protein KSW81_000386 [Chlorella desiccata (nom. nud.)]KAH7620980.1 hypothetical protein NADE_003589 [Chlorella desiccata (nom. nud.)]